MRRLLILSVAIAMGFTVPANAEPIDLSTVTCKKFFDNNKDNLTLLLMWLDGYYKDEDDDPIIDFDKMGENAKKLGEYCGKNPTHSIITAAEKTLLK